MSPRGQRNSSHQHDGLAQMMQQSMLHHNQYMEEERLRRNEEREARLMMQKFLTDTVSGAFAALNKFMGNVED